MRKEEKRGVLHKTVYSPGLDRQFEVRSESPELQKFIEEFEKSNEKAIVTCNQSEFFKEMVKLWENGQMKFLESNSFMHFVRFIYDHYEVRQEKNPDKPMSFETVKSRLKSYRNSN